MTQTVYAVYKAALAVNARLYHFHDPELITIALLLKLRRKLVVFDVHEDYPAGHPAKPWLRYNFIDAPRGLAVWLEKLAGFVFDGIVTVTPEIGQRFPASKTEVVRNFPMINLLDSAPSAAIVKASPATTFIFAGGHAWGLTPDRGMKELVSAVGLLKSESELWLIRELGE